MTTTFSAHEVLRASKLNAALAEKADASALAGLASASALAAKADLDPTTHKLRADQLPAGLAASGDVSAVQSALDTLTAEVTAAQAAATAAGANATTALNTANTASTAATAAGTAAAAAVATANDAADAADAAAAAAATAGTTATGAVTTADNALAVATQALSVAQSAGGDATYDRPALASFVPVHMPDGTVVTDGGSTGTLDVILPTTWSGTLPQAALWTIPLGPLLADINNTNFEVVGQIFPGSMPSQLGATMAGIAIVDVDGRMVGGFHDGTSFSDNIWYSPSAWSGTFYGGSVPIPANPKTGFFIRVGRKDGSYPGVYYLDWSEDGVHWHNWVYVGWYEAHMAQVDSVAFVLAGHWNWASCKLGTFKINVGSAASPTRGTTPATL